MARDERDPKKALLKWVWQEHRRLPGFQVV
jgi:hypothetical protein